MVDYKEWDEAFNNNNPTKEVKEAPTQEMGEKKSKFWQDHYYIDEDGNRKRSVNRVHINEDGSKIIENSVEDIYDENGNIHRGKEKGKNKHKNEVKAAGMSAVSKNNIPKSVDAQQQLVKDVAKEYNTDEKTAANLAGRETGGNNSVPAMAEAPKVDKVETKKPEPKPESKPSNDNDISTYEGAKKEIEDYRNIVDSIEDYYKDSIGSGLDDLSTRDKRILALDHIGTTIRNISKMQPYIGSIYGRQHEAEGIGNEKSMLDETISANLKGGLERRNKRMSEALDQQIKISNFPSDLKMKLSEIANENDLDFAQKKRLIEQEIYRYAKEMGIEVNMYNKKTDIDTAAQKQRTEDYQNRSYRPTGNIGINIPGFGNIGFGAQ